LPNVNPGPDITVCRGYPVTLTATGAGEGATYVWTNLVQNGVQFNPTATLTYTVTAVDIHGCINNAQVTVNALPLPDANLTANPLSGYSPLTVNFENTSTFSNSYFWDFGNGQTATTTNLASQQMTYVVEQPYDAWLYATNGYCSDSATVRINVLFKPDVWAPNVFTPNDDDVNTLFNIVTVNAAAIKLQIFNRWGNLMAEVTDLNGGWNGKTQSGADASDGVYFYKYLVTGVNGEELEGHGFLTLVR
jgi:gliding motility-associated-like protein